MIIIQGTAYLQCDSLFDYCLAFIACQFKGKTDSLTFDEPDLDITHEDLKQKYNITEELTEELEETIKNEHSYIFRGLVPDE